MNVNELQAPSTKPMIDHHYVVLLREHLKAKSKKNPCFSMRSFARSLKLCPSQLSRILSGKSTPTTSVVSKIAENLFSRESDQKLFHDLVNLSRSALSTESEGVASFIFSKLYPSESLPNPIPATPSISCWISPACFEALKLKSPPRSARELAERLDTDEVSVSLALNQLLQLNLIEPQDGWFCVKRGSEFPHAVSDVAPASFHKQIIAQALRETNRSNSSDRVIRARSISIKSDLLPAAREQIEIFLLELAKLERISRDNSDGVFQLNVQFFELLSCKDPIPSSEQEPA